jgi:hypothetical protein
MLEEMAAAWDRGTAALARASGDGSLPWAAEGATFALRHTSTSPGFASTKSEHLENEFVKAIFGVISLLVVLAVVALLATGQLRSSASVRGATEGTASSPAMASPRNVEQQARDAVAEALQQGSERNRNADR